MALVKILAITAGLGQPSSSRLLADRLSASASEQLRERGHEVSVEVLEVRDLAHDIVNAMVAGFPSAALTAAFESIASADGIVAVTPIFSASYSGLFKSLFDVLDADVLKDMPVLLGATAGTARHSLAIDHALRPLFAYLHADVVTTAVFAAPEDWGSGAHDSSDGSTPLSDRIGRAAEEFATAIERSRRTGARDPWALEQPFGQLLGGFSAD